MPHGSSWEPSSFRKPRVPTLKLEEILSHSIHIYGISTYIYHKHQPNAGKYTIHGSYGYGSLGEKKLPIFGSIPRAFKPSGLWWFQMSHGQQTRPDTFHYLTWPMDKRLKLFGITYLVGKISRSNFFFFRVQDG